MSCRDGIAGHGNQRDVTGVDEACRKHRVGWFATDAVVDLGVWIKLHIKLAFHETRRCFFEFGHTIVGIAAVFRLIDFLCHHIANGLIGHRIIFTNAKVQECTVRMIGKCFSLGTLDLFKLVDLGVFTVI